MDWKFGSIVNYCKTGEDGLEKINYSGLIKELFSG